MTKFIRMLGFIAVMTSTIAVLACGELEAIIKNPGETGSGSTQAKDCSYGGKRIDSGAAFPAADGCNTCTCDRNSGLIACTKKYCPKMQAFNGTISKLDYDEESNTLIATLTYQACKEMKFDLSVDQNSCGKSYPWQCYGEIFFAEASDSCTSELSHQVIFPLTELTKRPANLYIQNASGSCTRVVVGRSDGGLPNLCS